MPLRPLLALLTRRPRSVLLLWGLALLLVIWFVRDLQPVLDVQGFYPDGSQAPGELAETLGREFLEADRVVVVVESEAPLAPATVAGLIDDLELALVALDGVGAVTGRLSPDVRRYREHILPRRLVLFAEEAEIETLIERLSPDSIQARLGGVGGRPKGHSGDPLGLARLVREVSERMGAGAPVGYQDGYLTDRRGTRYFLLVEPAAPTADFAVQARLVDGIETALGQLRTRWRETLENHGVQIYAVGRANAQTAGYRALRADATQSMALSLVLVYGCFALFFRRPIAAVCALLPIAFSIGMTLLLGRWLFGEPHLITLVFCVLLVGLGIDFAFHMAAHFWTPSTGPSVAASLLERIHYAVRQPSRGIVLGALTSATAFLALTASSYPAIRQTGTLIAVGILVLLPATFGVVPAVLRLWPGQGAGSGNPTPRWNYILHGLIATRRRRIAGGALWVGLAILATAGVARLRFEGHPWNVLVQGNPAVAALDRLTGEVGVSFYPLTVVSQGDSPAEALARDQRFYRQIMAVSKRVRIAFVNSLSAHVPPAEQQIAVARKVRDNPITFDPVRFRRDYGTAVAAAGNPFDARLHRDYPATVARFLDVDVTPITLESLGQEGLGALVARHLREVDGRWYVATQLYPRLYPWHPGALTAFLRFWEEVVQDTDPPPLLLGKPLRSELHRRAIREDTLHIVLVAVLGVGALLWMGLRRGNVVLKTLVPLALGVWLLAGFMGFAGIKIHFINLAVLPILFGIGVDDGIHIAERFRRRESLRRIYAEAAPGLIMTSVTTAVAFLSLLLAQHPGIRELGLCGAIGVMTCLASSLHLLPLLYRYSEESATPSRSAGTPEHRTVSRASARS